MRYLITTILLALAPLSWGEVRLVCTGTMVVQNLSPWRKTERDYQLIVVLQNERRPFSAKIVGGRSLPMEVSDDKERYVGKEGSFEQGDYISWSIHRQTLELSSSGRLGDREEFLTARCKKAEFKPNI